MKAILKYSCVLGLVLCQLSCSNWLDLGSEDRIMEKNLFDSKDGFYTALNGIYVELLDHSLYGSTLTYGTVDILAQYYDCSNVDHIYNKLAKFDTEAKNKAVEATWSKAWFLINNVNTLLEHCESNKHVLGEESYHIIKGEVLALRGLLHFELFKIFGPIYSIDKEQKCMPYARTSDLVVLEMLSAEQVQDYILKDFKAAEQLLMDYDPVITEGALFADAGNGLPNTMRYRSLRLNYYAVLAYIARVAVYVGNTTMAADYAEKVIKGTQIENKWFPFVTREAAEEVDHQDRVYQTEILFGLYNLRRKQIYEATFSNNLSKTRVLRPKEDYIDWMYDEDLNDLRGTWQWELMSNPEDEKENQRYFVKYKEVDDKGLGFQYLMPLMRISEMYLIAAECLDDIDLKFEYLNNLRAARKVASVGNDKNIMDEIEKEYRREFIGEGQLFWFFKRQNKGNIIAGDESSVVMLKDKYLFRLPQAEEDHRGTNY